MYLVDRHIVNLIDLSHICHCSCKDFLANKILVDWEIHIANRSIHSDMNIVLDHDFVHRYSIYLHSNMFYYKHVMLMIDRCNLENQILQLYFFSLCELTELTVVASIVCWTETLSDCILNGACTEILTKSKRIQLRFVKERFSFFSNHGFGMHGLTTMTMGHGE